MSRIKRDLFRHKRSLRRIYYGHGNPYVEGKNTDQFWNGLTTDIWFVQANYWQWLKSKRLKMSRFPPFESSITE